MAEVDDLFLEEEDELIEEEVYNLFDKQSDFVLSDARFCAYGGGMGNGKTLAGCIKLYQHCQENPGAFFLVGRKDGTLLEISTTRDFLGLFGHLGTWREKARSFKFENGSEVIFRGVDDMNSLTNMNLSGFWIDQAEEVSEDSFTFLVGRMRRKVGKRQAWVTFNMNGHDWIWRRFLMGKDSDGNTLTNRPDYHLVVATTMENPYLPEDYVQSMLSQPKSWVNRYVYGSFDEKAGRIFDEWKELIHVVEPFRIPDEWERVRAIDHGASGDHATCCLWGAVDFEGNVWIYQEYYQYQKTVSYNAEEIKKLSIVRDKFGQLKEDHYTYTVIDPSMHRKSQEKDGYQFSVADEYNDHGIITMNGQNDVMASINRVNEYLKVNEERPHPVNSIDGQFINGAARLYIFSSCSNLLRELPEYTWKPTRFDTGTDQQKEAPIKRDDHAVDALRYLIMSRPLLPSVVAELPAWIFQNPIELARAAKDMGRSVDDLINMRFRNTHGGRTRGGSISHEGRVTHDNRLDPII